MRIDIITVLPELLKSPFEASILKRAIEKGLVEVLVLELERLQVKVIKGKKQDLE